MPFTLRSNLDQMMSQFSEKVRARLPLAGAIAINKTLAEVKPAVVEEMTQVFDRPTPYTLNSVYSKGATPASQEGTVWLKDDFLGGGSHPATEYLIPEIEGGVRAEKRSEYILRAAGVLPPGLSAIPGDRATLDAYGNISRGQVQAILSYLRLSDTVSGRTSNRPVGALNKRQARKAATQARYFVAAKDSAHGRHLAPGIYERTANGINAVLMFRTKPQYAGVLDFEGVCQRKAEDVFQGHLREQIAISVARAG